jgi:uncharacterized membrane protein (Fun14 family)
MNLEHVSPIVTTIGGGFFVGVLIGYALKKVAKIAAVIIGLFSAGLAFLQYQQILNLNWDRLREASHNGMTTIANAITQIPGFSTSGHPTSLAISNLGIPLTGSMSMGFAIGFVKG